MPFFSCFFIIKISRKKKEIFYHKNFFDSYHKCMKNTFYVASLFVCAFIGAGFSSGEEIKAFFPSGYGPSGVIFSACLLIFTPLLLTELCFSLNVFSYKEFLSVSLKKFSLFLYNISNFFLLCMFATRQIAAYRKVRLLQSHYKRAF